MKKNINNGADNNVFKIILTHRGCTKYMLLNYPLGKIMVNKKDLVYLTGIKRKTLNTLIGRGKIETFKSKGIIHVGLIEILLYLKSRNEKKGSIK